MIGIQFEGTSILISLIYFTLLEMTVKDIKDKKHVIYICIEVYKILYSEGVVYLYKTQLLFSANK